MKAAGTVACNGFRTKKPEVVWVIVPRAHRHTGVERPPIPSGRTAAYNVVCM